MYALGSPLDFPFPEDVRLSLLYAFCIMSVWFTYDVRFMFAKFSCGGV